MLCQVDWVEKGREVQAEPDGQNGAAGRARQVIWPDGCARRQSPEWRVILTESGHIEVFNNSHIMGITEKVCRSASFVPSEHIDIITCSHLHGGALSMLLSC